MTSHSRKWVPFIITVSMMRAFSSEWEQERVMIMNDILISKAYWRATYERKKSPQDSQSKPFCFAKRVGKIAPCLLSFLTLSHKKKENRGRFLQKYFSVILRAWPSGQADTENLDGNRRPFEFSPTHPSRFLKHICTVSQFFCHSN